MIQCGTPDGVPHFFSVICFVQGHIDTKRKAFADTTQAYFLCFGIKKILLEIAVELDKMVLGTIWFCG
ncbi:MAG: hypothetical protein J6B95_01565 [Oscillospiraceae bacterium]|nr:hypothetical protein [Oscillospiraceae bacterium]